MKFNTWWTKNSDTIMCGVALAGLGAIVEGSVSATHDVDRLWGKTYNSWIEETGNGNTIQELGHYQIEKAKVCWKAYLKVAIPVFVTGTAIVLMHLNHKKTAAIMTMAYGSVASALNEMDDSAKAVLSPKKYDELRSHIFKKHADETGEDIRKNAIIHKPDADPNKPGMSVIYDDMSQNYFYGCIEDLQRIEADLNAQLSEGDFDIDVNDIYDRIDGVEIQKHWGEYFGWKASDFKSHPIRFEFYPQLDDTTNEPYVVFAMNPEPFSTFFTEC